jgi:hypothetical protein
MNANASRRRYVDTKGAMRSLTRLLYPICPCYVWGMRKAVLSACVDSHIVVSNPRASHTAKA